MGIKTVPQPPYSTDFAPCDFCLFPKLRGCCYEEMKEVVTKFIDTLTQEDFHGALQKLLGRYNKCIAAGGDYLVGGLKFHVCIINKSAHTKKVWKLIVCTSYIYIYIYIYILRERDYFILFCFYNYIYYTGCVKKKQIMQFVNEKYIINRYQKNKLYKKKKRRKHPYCLKIINQYRNI